MAKLSSASIRLVQKKNRMMRDGSFPIYIVVCFSGRVEKSTGVSCLPKYWDSKREVVKNGCPNAPVLNKTLSDIKQRVIEKKNYYEFQGRSYTPSMLLENSVIDLSINSGDYWNLSNRIIEERRLRDGTIKRYVYTYRKLCEFIGRKSFIVEELNLGRVKDFANWLEKNGINTNTIKSLLGCISSVWNYAVSNKIADESIYPFKTFKYTQKYKEGHRDYFLEKSHIIRLRDYFLNLVIRRNGELWSYRDEAFDRLHKRYTAEFGILWFLMSYKCNGSAPIELALLKGINCSRVKIRGEDYFAIDIKRRKTSRDVHIRLKRDIMTIIGLEHFLGMSSNGYVYPIINWGDGLTERQLMEQCHKIALKATVKVREAFKKINENIARDNAEKGLNEPLVETDRLVFYTVRHSFAQHYLSSPGATVNGLASLMARSPNTIATYVKQITRDDDIAEAVENLPI